MRLQLSQLSQQARLSVQRKNWSEVHNLARQIKNIDKNEPEGYFLGGLAEKAAGRNKLAVSAFKKALKLNSQRYDAAIELAHQHLLLLEHNEAFNWVNRYEKAISNSPLYLDMAASVFSGLGLHARAWPLYQQANKLQPEIDLFSANLAACSVLVGKVNEAKSIYQRLISKYPLYQKNHYELSKLATASDEKHVVQMQKILRQTQLSPDKNIYMYYALGKELEDLGRWKESFDYYEKAGKAILSVANYDVQDDIQVIEKIIKTCSAEWLATENSHKQDPTQNKTPIFIVGLPRTGTTLIERILSSHSQVESADETFFMQMAIRHASSEGGISDINEKIIKKAAKANILRISQHYMASIKYRLSGNSFFIDKYPFNYLYLGFIAKAFPNARIIYLKRKPMDACFALFKQSFFKFAYSLDDLGRYYLAQDKLRKHWQSILGDRMIELDYEALVSNQETNTKALLMQLGLPFEQACLEFEKNPNASATASTVQVREKMHTRSVNKWKKYSEQLAPLQKFLEKSGIDTQ